MSKQIISREAFERFLNLLDTDREIAGQKYEEIRLRLTKIFYARGCHTADELADETMDRAARKLGEMAETYEGDPIPYIFGVSKKVFLEYRRRPKTAELPDTMAQLETDPTETEAKYKCLEECLKKLRPDDRELITNFYQGIDRFILAENRKKLAKQLGITSQSLRVRLFRVRHALERCILDCLVQK